MTDHPILHILKQAGDWTSVGLILATFASVLPSIASLLSISWFLIRLYDRWKYGPIARRAQLTDD
ncbi:hypothetical protein O4H52_07845 [Sphingomonadaceae bacterium G21617-S1]|nr:hypothetical protein [Sphingomonadaceae bacterium G21617-S1]